MELENIVANTVYLKAREGKRLYDDNVLRISMLLGSHNALPSGLPRYIGVRVDFRVKYSG